MPSAVVDTNVIVSGVISDRGAPREVLEAWHSRRFDLVTAPSLITEVARALRYEKIISRYGLSEADVRAVLALLWTQSTLVDDPVAVEAMTRDPADDLVLAVRRASGAEFLVTGDRDLLAISDHADTQIVTPRAFIAGLP